MKAYRSPIPFPTKGKLLADIDPGVCRRLKTTVPRAEEFCMGDVFPAQIYGFDSATRLAQ